MVVYEEYIRSTRWKRKREEYFRSGRPKFCQGCKDKSIRQIHLHHKTYDRLGNEDLDDLVPVCEACHAMIHERHGMDDKSLWQVTDLVLMRMQKNQHRREASISLVNQTPKRKSKQSLQRLQEWGETGRRRTSKTSTKWEMQNAEYVRLRDAQVVRNFTP